MNRTTLRLGLALPLLLACAPRLAPPTTLDDYVARPDDSFSWEIVHREETEDATNWIVRLTSQTWRHPDEVDHPVWTHWLRVVRPRQLRHDIVLLLIDGGRRHEEPPSRVEPLAITIARQTGCVTAWLPTVPNQPLSFADDPRPRWEDGLLAHSFHLYLKAGDDEWPALLPMAKSAVRAMDAIEALLAREGLRAGGFFLTGASKRGWTTWLTAAVDRRVVAIAPAVIDMLNADPSLRHHHASYGFWSPAIRDYVEKGLPEWLDTPQGQRLIRIVDPFSYRARLTMPKYVVNGCGDEFFVPDSWRFYWNDLPDPKLLWYVPNAGHGLNMAAYASILAFVHAVVNQRPLPRVTWTLQDDGSLAVLASPPPQRATLWTATNHDARDFRTVAGLTWSAQPLEGNDGRFAARVPPPPRGWTAFLVEFAYDVGAPAPLMVSTGVHVVPPTLPFAPAEGR